MEIINNAYRILKTENINRYFNTYLVQNIADTSRLGRMYILNMDTFPQETFSFLTKEYYYYIHQRNSYITKVREFGTIHMIDTRTVEKQTYFLLAEYEEETEILLDKILDTEDSDRLLGYIVDILRIFDLTTRKDIRYPYIDGQSLYMTKKGQVKLKNTAIIHLERLLNFKAEGDILYLSPECFRGNPSTVKSEIYAVGVYLENFFKNKKFIAQYRKPLNKIIQKMKSYYENQRYDSFVEIISDINENLGLDFPIVFEKKSIYFKEELIFDEQGNLMGQGEYCNRIFEKVQRFHKGLDGFFLYEISGDLGTGKTVFINYMEYMLSVEGMNVFTDHSKDEVSKRRSIEYVLLRIIEKKMITHIKKYPKVEELLRGGGVITDESSTIAQVGEFISEIISDESTCFLLDDLQRSDRITLGVLKYLSHCIGHNQRLIIIYSTDQPIELKKTGSFPMNNLNLEETGYFIRKIIGMRQSSDLFFMKVYEETQGNIGKIKEVITEMYHQKMLYMHRDGRWIIRVDTYDKLIFPYKKENDIVGFLNSINETQRKIILEMAMLKNPYTAMEFSEISELSLPVSTIEENFDQLVQTGFICLSFGDLGYHYDFRDKYIKRKLYEGIDAKDQRRCHQRIVDRLLNLNLEKNIKYIGELTYQLRKTHSYLKASFYANKLSKIFMEKEQRNDALAMVKESVECAEMAKDDRRLLAACFRYAQMLSREYKLREAIRYYDGCIAIAHRLGRHDVEADCLIGLSEIYILLNDFGKSDQCLDRIKRLLGEHPKHAGYLRYLIAFSQNRIQSDRYEQMAEVVEELDRFLAGESEDCKGEYYTIKGILLSEQGYLDEAEAYQKRGVEILEKTDNYRWISSAYNNFGVFYAVYRQDYRQAMHYYRKLIEVAEKHHLPNARVVGYFNLGEELLFDYKIEKAEEYFNISLKESIRIDKQNVTFCNYIVLADVMFWKINILAAKNYLEKADQELAKFPFQGRALYSYYKLKARFHLFNGDSKKAKSFIQKAVWEASGIEKSEINIIQAYANIFLGKDESNYRHIRTIIEEIRGMAVYPSFVVKALFLLCFVKRTEYEKDVLELIDWIRINVTLEEGTVPHRLMNQLQVLYSGGEFVLDDSFNDSNMKQGYLYLSYLSFFYYMEKGLYFKAINVIVQLYVDLRDIMKASRMEMRFDNHLGLAMHRLIDFIEDFSLIKNVEELRDLVFREQSFGLNNSRTFYQSRFGDNRILHQLIGNPLVQKIIQEGLGIKNSDVDTKELVAKLKYSNIENIKHILEYIVKLSWASGAAVVMKQNKKYVQVVSMGEFIDMKDMETIVRQTEILEDKIVSSKYWNADEKRKAKKEIFQDRNFMCIPIFNNKNQQSERRVSSNILGFVYLESNVYIDNFTKETYEQFKHWSNLIGVFLENHNLSTRYMLDKLTGAYNRQHFDSYIKNELEECQQFREQTFSLVMMDIDHFKQVNDTYGHAEGDILLQNFVRIVQESIRSYDMFARYGGEEFMLILKNMNSESAWIVSERIRNALEKKLKDPGGKPVTASLGISSFMEHGVWEDELIRRADMAMYYSKSSGRNRVTIWDEHLGDGKQFQMDSMATPNFHFDDHEAERLFINGMGLLRLGGGEQKVRDYLTEIMDYFKAEKFFISLFKENDIWAVEPKSVGKISSEEKEQLNHKIVTEVIQTHKPIFTIDWENITYRDDLTGIPDWDSILCVPILRNSEVKGFLYMKSSFRTKEFTSKDSWVLQFLTTIISELFQG